MLRKLWDDRSGNFGIMTAILMVPLLGAAGLALDFSQALALKTRLQGGSMRNCGAVMRRELFRLVRDCRSPYRDTIA